jgi:hypothetical protein
MEGIKTTRPMVVFVAVMLAVLGLVFALENMRPRVRVIEGEKAAPEPRRPQAVAAATRRRV